MKRNILLQDINLTAQASRKNAERANVDAQKHSMFQKKYLFFKSLKYFLQFGQ